SLKILINEQYHKTHPCPSTGTFNQHTTSLPKDVAKITISTWMPHQPVSIQVDSRSASPQWEGVLLYVVLKQIAKGGNLFPLSLAILLQQTSKYIFGTFND